MTGSEAPLRPDAATRAPDEVAITYRLSRFTLFSIKLRTFVIDATMSLVHDRPLSVVLPTGADADGWLIKGVPPDARLDFEQLYPQHIVCMRRLYERHFIDLESGFQHYTAAMSGKTRATLRRKVRRFEEAEGKAVDFRAYRTPAEVAAFLPVAQEIAARTYQARLLRAGMPTTASFRASTLAKAEAGAIRAFLLYLRGQPISFLFFEIHEKRAVYAFLGYLPEFGKLSPGIVLHWLAIESLFADPAIALLDFTEGGGQHKEVFSSFSRTGADIFVLQRRLRNRAVIASTKLFDGGVELGRTLWYKGLSAVGRR